MSARPGAVLHVLVGVITGAGLIGMLLLWPGADVPVVADETTELVDATLLQVRVLDADPALTAGLPDAVPVEITARLADGELVTFETVDETGGRRYEAGQAVRLGVAEVPGSEPLYFISDFRRATPLLALVVLFVVAVVAFGRWDGLRALVGLGVTFAVVLAFVVPAIVADRDPVAVALVGATVIAVATLLITHKPSAKTSAAVVGTVAALLLTVGLAALFLELGQITGLASEDAVVANLSFGGLNLRGLLLAGIILGALGVLDDVTIAQASTVLELRRANPGLSTGDVIGRALNVGRDHIAATVNTLVLAYAGAALPLLLLFSVGADPPGTVLSSEVVATEIVRALVGSLGLLAAVPMTTVLAAVALRPEGVVQG